MPGEDAPASARLTVRRYQPGDETAILDLFTRAFHAPRSLEHWRWEYQQNPFGREHISVALDGGRMVGHYAGYPVLFRTGGADVLAHQIGDAMTDQTARHIGRGPTAVFGRTVLHFYEAFCENAIAFNYGFTAGTHQAFTIRFLRSFRVEPVTYRECRGPFRAPGRLMRRLSGYRFEVVTRAGPEFDAFFERVAPRYEFLVRRDARYLQWRYFDCPDIKYVVVTVKRWGELAGWIVYRMRDHRLILGDALFSPGSLDAIRMVLHHVAAAHGASVIEGWFPPRPHWFHHALSAAGFVEKPEPQDLSLMCARFTMTDATSRMRESLYYTMGDSDLF